MSRSIVQYHGENGTMKRAFLRNLFSSLEFLMGIESCRHHGDFPGGVSGRFAYHWHLDLDEWPKASLMKGSK